MSSLAAFVVLAALSTGGNGHSATMVTQEVATQQAESSDPIRLENVEVTGRPLSTLIDSFVAEVAAPAGRRNLARWNTPICISVLNLQETPARFISDSLDTVRRDLGLRRAGRDCQPNVVIIASAEPDALAETVTDRLPRSFRPGGPGMDRGGAALEAFKSSDAAVRWWTVSTPVDSLTGRQAVRIAGQCSGNCASIGDFAPGIAMPASRITTPIVDEIIKTVVIVDIDRVADVTSRQLVDYLAMVVFAQIDPLADTSAYASVLNVFDAPDVADGLTQWDRAYIQGLYQAHRAQLGAGAARDEIATSIRRAHSRLTLAEE